MHRTIIVGSPRANGKSAMLADELFDACIEDCPEDGVSIISIESLDIAPCTGCDGCKLALAKDDAGYLQIPDKDDLLAQTHIVFKSDAASHVCVIDDDMVEVRKHIDAADELIVVSPVYFSGPPAQLKALLDRMQPYFWSNIRAYTKQRRPMTLHVIRESDNPYGFDALVSTVRSAFGVGGFKLERVLDWQGCLDEDGEIVSEPVEFELAQNCARSEVSASEKTKSSQAESTVSKQKQLQSKSTGGKQKSSPAKNKNGKQKQSPAKGKNLKSKPSQAKSKNNR